MLEYVGLLMLILGGLGLVVLTSIAFLFPDEEEFKKWVGPVKSLGQSTEIGPNNGRVGKTAPRLGADQRKT
jgi:hypothetical protein